MTSLVLYFENNSISWNEDELELSNLSDLKKLSLNLESNLIGNAGFENIVDSVNELNNLTELNLYLKNN